MYACICNYICIYSDGLGTSDIQLSPPPGDTADPEGGPLSEQANLAGHRSATSDGWQRFDYGNEDPFDRLVRYVLSFIYSYIALLI